MRCIRCKSGAELQMLIWSTSGSHSIPTSLCQSIFQFMHLQSISSLDGTVYCDINYIKKKSLAGVLFSKLRTRFMLEVYICPFSSFLLSSLSSPYSFFSLSILPDICSTNIQRSAYVTEKRQICSLQTFINNLI